MTRRLPAFGLAILLTLTPLAARAQSDTGMITVSIVDNASEGALQDVRVILTGAAIASSLTNKSGVVKYTDVPTGIYRVRVIKRGYDGARSSEFEVLANKDVTVKFALNLSATAPSNGENLKVIGAVVVRSNVTINSNDISDESPIRRLSDSMTDALDKLAGVSVNQDSNDPNSALTVSLRGRDESQTGLTLDGIPLSAPGVAGNLRSMNTDLFSGARTSFSPSAGSLGGSVNFRTLEPTQSWQEKIAASYGTYDRANYQIAVTGSQGPLGIAVQHTWRGSNNPLTFQDYADFSGLTYAHGGFGTNLGDGVKLRYRLGDRTTLTTSMLSSNSFTSLLCTRDVTNLPCGIGPGNNQYGKFQFGYGTVSSLIGNVAFTATAFATSNKSITDELNRYINGIPSPFASTNSGHTNGYAMTASIAHAKHTISLAANTYSSITQFVPTTNTSAFVLPSATGISARQLTFTDAIKSNDKLGLNYNFSLANTSGVGSSVLGGIGAGWRPTGNDTFNGSIALGSSQPGSNLPRSLSDPQSARFTCGAGTTIVNGPGDGPQAQSSINYSLDWTHQWRGGQLTASAFRQTQSGQTINALINAASEPAGYLPPGYVAQLAGVWSQATICGGTPFNPAGVYVQQPVSGTARAYQGIDISGQLKFGPNIVVLPTYSLNEAILLAADSRLAGAQSTSIVGAQLPGRPLHRAGVTVDGILPRSGFELLANAQYTGSNNNRYLTPYTVLSAGISHAVGQGRLTVFANNLFNAVSGSFTTLQFAQAVPVNGGGAILFPANPLLPRAITATYQINMGRGSKRATSDLAAIARQAGGGAGPRGGPTGPGGPGQGGPGGFQFRPNVLPPGGDPLSLALTNTACDADAQSIARPILDGLRSYVNAYEAKQPLPVFPGFVITPHVNPAGSGLAYWLEIRPEGVPVPGSAGSPDAAAARGNVSINGQPIATPVPSATPAAPEGQPSPAAGARQAVRQGGGGQGGGGQGARFRAVFACTYLARLAPDDAKAKGIDTNGRVFFGYAPGIGLFGVQPRQLPAGGGSVTGSGGG